MEQLLQSVVELASQVGKEVAVIYQKYLKDAVLDVSIKPDDSPVMDADLLAHQLLTTGLNNIDASLPVLSEELAVKATARLQWQRYWLIDPVDGTRDFISQSGNFSINIALIEDHHPILGVVYVPVDNTCYFAAKGLGAFKQVGLNSEHIAIHVRKTNASKITVMVSRHHKTANIREFLTALGDHEIINVGSALKFGLIAEGKADIYLRLGPTSEWDTAAGQCILEQAGGKVVDLSWQPLRYNTKDSVINPHFVAIGDPVYDWRRYLKDFM